jgi:glycosyltransferase involved in cell wall biosynthesis
MKQVLRILWVAGSRVVGGAERATLQLAADLAARGHLLHMLCPPTSALRDVATEHRLAYTPAPIGNTFNVFAYPAIRRAVARHATDLVLVTGMHDWIWCGLGASRPAALVLARHTNLPLSRPIAALVNRRADAVIAVSNAVRDTLVERSAIDPKLVHVIANPCRYPVRDSPPTAAERALAREKLALRGDGTWVGFFGGFAPGKGIDDALRATRDAAATVAPLHLLVTRGGRRWRSDAAADQARLAAAGLGENLHVIGEQRDMDVVLTAVDATLIATRRELGEALPLTAIESLACGTPVVAYRLGGVPEVIGENGEAGCLAAPDDAADLGRQLTALLGDREHAARCAAAGLERARTLFAPQRIADRYEQLFTELVKEGPRGGRS